MVNKTSKMKNLSFIILIMLGFFQNIKAQNDLSKLEGFYGIYLGYNIGNYDAKLKDARDYKIVKLKGEPVNFENTIETNLAGNIILIKIEIKMSKSEWLLYVEEYKQKYIGSSTPSEFLYGETATTWLSSDKERILNMYYPKDRFDKKLEGTFGVIEYGYLKK